MLTRWGLTSFSSCASYVHIVKHCAVALTASLTCFPGAVINTKTQNNLVRVSHQGKLGQKPWGHCPQAHIQRPFSTAQAHLPRESTTHGRRGFPTSVSHGENAPQILIKAVLKLGLLTARLSHHRTPVEIRVL